MLRRMAGIIARELRGHGSGSGKITKRFLGSITHKGAIWRFDSVDTLCPRVYEFADRYETAGGLLEIIQAEAVRRNYDVIACMAPENITRMEHLLIPELGLAFVTSRPGMEYVESPAAGSDWMRWHIQKIKLVSAFADGWPMCSVKKALPRFRRQRRPMTGWRAFITPMWILTVSGHRRRWRPDVC